MSIVPVLHHCPGDVTHGDIQFLIRKTKYNWSNGVGYIEKGCTALHTCHMGVMAAIPLPRCLSINTGRHGD